MNQLIEKNLSDLISNVEGKNVGIISAFRSAYDKKENLRRTKELQNDLNHAGLRFTKLTGHYIEGFGSKSEKAPKKEISFLVFADKNDDDKGLEQIMKELGEKYNQDSIIFKPFDSDSATLIGTSKHDEDGNKIVFPGFKKEIELGEFKPDKMGDFYSRMKGRNFVFESFVFQPFSLFVENKDRIRA